MHCRHERHSTPNFGPLGDTESVDENEARARSPVPSPQSPPLMRAEVFAVGDELTTGQRLDTNSQWLSERLIEMGVDIAFHTTVGDNLADHIVALRTAIGRVDVIVSTGGIGPTADDLTRDAFAAA